MKSTTAKVLAIIFLLALTAAQLRAGTGESTNSETDSYNVNLKADLFNNTSALAGISLTIMVLLLVAIALYARHHREKMLHETLRTMIEKGIPVNSEIVAQLGRRGRGNGSAKSRSRHLLPGLILTGAGIVLVIDLPWHFVGGWIVLVIGLAFLIVWLSEIQMSGPRLFSVAKMDCRMRKPQRYSIARWARSKPIFCVEKKS